MGKHVLLTLIAIMMLVTEVSARTVSVGKFGARPDDSRSDTEALRRAAAYCRQHPQTTLFFPAGTYQLDDPMAIDIERRAISGALGRGTRFCKEIVAIYVWATIATDRQDIKPWDNLLMQINIHLLLYEYKYPINCCTRASF